jgi:hypothetical protein
MKGSTGLAVAVALLLGSALHAEDNIQIHGFGGWSYGKSQDLSYLGATTKGNADNASFSLNVSARPYERLTIVSQVRFDSAAANEADLDFAFAEWAISDKVKVRAGRVKHPLGLYGEVFDVGTVRPFQSLPQSVYGPIGTTAKAYNGAGLTGLVRQGDWEMQYDVYAGEIDGDYMLALPPSATSTASPHASPAGNIGFRYRNVFGGRVHVRTPIDGLLVGVSAFRGKDDFVASSFVKVADRTVYLGSAEYVRGPLQIRTEWGEGESEGIQHYESGYVEAAYHITPKWQLASRWETLDLEVPAFPQAFRGPLAAVLEHRDLAVGVNYWFNANLVVRANYHMVDGNRFAFPDTNQAYLQAVTTNSLPTESSALIVGAQFSF